MNIISRGEWGARSPRSRNTVSWSARREFIVHYTEGPTDQSIKSIQNFHLDGRRWSDVGYNFLVSVTGKIYEGRGWTVVGAHAPDHNTSGIGVSMIGRDGDATPEALRAIRWLYDEACKKAGRKLEKLGHRDVYATSCPGAELYAWVRAGMPVDGLPSGPTEEDPLLGLKKGDKGERVAALQLMIKAAGQDLPEYGVDWHYGAETAEALRKVRVSVGSKAAREKEGAAGRGEVVDPWAFEQLHTAVARNQGQYDLHKV